MNTSISVKEISTRNEQSLKTLQKLKFNILQNHMTRMSKNCLQMFVLDNQGLRSC